MSRISVTPEELASQAGVYQRAAAGIQDQINAVQAMNGQIAGEWEDAAFQSYLAQYEQLAGHVNQFVGLMNQIHSQVVDYAGLVAERDQQDARAFGLM